MVDKEVVQATLEQRQRLRIVFGKQGAMKYIGHLDVAKTWERILRRAQISLSYSQGFVARPKIQLASPLALGVTSEAELMDVWLDRTISLEGLAGKLTEVSPPGLPIYSITEVPIKSPALQTQVRSLVYRIAVDGGMSDHLREKVNKLATEPHLIRRRRDKTYDLKPLILNLMVDSYGRIVVELASTPQGTGRPDEVIDALGLSDTYPSIHRVAINLREADAIDSDDSVPEDMSQVDELDGDGLENESQA